MLNSRLKEERTRLGLTQQAFAEFSLAKKRTIADWEKGVSSPTAVQLEALSKIGFDVLYVVTGMRSATIAEQKSTLLNREEEVLLDNFRNSSPEAKAALKATSNALAQREVNKKIS
jgi:transcriptional regulator with XRE-family HTH domain